MALQKQEEKIMTQEATTGVGRRVKFLIGANT
jgi:hypothetical protein